MKLNWVCVFVLLVYLKFCFIVLIIFLHLFLFIFSYLKQNLLEQSLLWLMCFLIDYADVRRFNIEKFCCVFCESESGILCRTTFIRMVLSMRICSIPCRCHLRSQRVCFFAASVNTWYSISFFILYLWTAVCATLACCGIDCVAALCEVSKYTVCLQTHKQFMLKSLLLLTLRLLSEPGNLNNVF